MAGLLNFIGAFAVFVTVLLASSALVPLALAYVALRVRDAREPDPDPKLGAKTAFHLIHSIGILMVLTGLTISAMDLLNGTIAPKMPAPQGGFVGRAQVPKEDGFNTAQRTAAALAGVGVLFALLFWGLLLGTNDHSRRAVRRVFVGGRMALSFLILMTAVAGLAAVLVQKDPNYEIAESLLGILLVWFGASVFHLLQFQSATREPRSKRPRDTDGEAWTPPRA